MIPVIFSIRLLLRLVVNGYPCFHKVTQILPPKESLYKRNQPLSLFSSFNFFQPPTSLSATFFFQQPPTSNLQPPTLLADRRTRVDRLTGLDKMQFTCFILGHQDHAIAFNATHLTGGKIGDYGNLFANDLFRFKM